MDRQQKESTKSSIAAPTPGSRHRHSHLMSRRQSLGCMAWAGTGLLWTLSGGVPHSLGLIGEARAEQISADAFSFVQISDTHIGFNKEANPDVVGTLQRAIGDVNKLEPR